MPSDYDIEFKPLELVCGFHDNIGVAHAVEMSPQQILLIIMRNADGDSLRRQLLPCRPPFTSYTWAPECEAIDESTNELYDPRISRQHRSIWQFEVCPSVSARRIEQMVNFPVLSMHRNCRQQLEPPYVRQDSSIELKVPIK